LKRGLVTMQAVWSIATGGVLAVALISTITAGITPREPAPATTPAEPTPSPAATTTSNTTTARIPSGTAHRFPYAQIWTGDKTTKKIALTFDDGPFAGYSERLLDVLRQENVRATFFYIGRNVDMAPDIARRAHFEGHDVYNHTYNHIRLTNESIRTVERELIGGADAIERATGERPSVFRTPGGGYGLSVLEVSNRLGLTMAQWSSNAQDATRSNGTNPSPAEIARQVVKSAHPGAIVLLHEPAPGTIGALPIIIRDLRAEGYEFVPLSEIMAQPNAVITSFDAAMARGNFSPRDYILP